MKESRTDRKKSMVGVVPESIDGLVPKKIARRAYELYLKRGGVNGYDMEDWLQAEREILQEECE